MKFSLFFNFDALPELDTPSLLAQIEEQVIAADRLGFAAIYLAEHHFTEYGRMPAPLTLLARLSALTEHIDLGVAVVEAPYYHPLRLAEEAALLDRLSGGRLRLGIGSGAANKPLEFARFGIPLEEKGPRTLEITEIVRQALSGNLVNFDGEFFSYQDVALALEPVRPAGELLWMAASRRSIDYAGRHAMPLLLPRPVPESTIEELIGGYRATLPADSPGYIAALRFVFVGETTAEALAMAQRTFQRYAKYDAATDWDGATSGAEYERLCAHLKFIAGTPDEVEAQLRLWIADLGVDEIICQMYAAGTRCEDALRSMMIFARDVMPRFA